MKNPSVEALDQIRASVDEAFAEMDKCRVRPDQLSQAALDEMRANLRRLRQTFSEYEIVVDRIAIAGQLSAPSLAELTHIVRTVHKLLDDCLFNMPDRGSRRGCGRNG